MKNVLFFIVLCLLSNIVDAECQLTITREACAGKEDISYKKCNGKQTCTEFTEATSAGVCKEDAIAACANSRTSITKQKIISATFNGKELLNKTNGTDFCMDYPERKKEFDQCSK